jgi:hypothetical protein
MVDDEVLLIGDFFGVDRGLGGVKSTAWEW